MPIIYKQKGEVMSDALKVLSKLKKDMGDQIGSKGVELRSVERIPLGIFSLDLAANGGIPKGRVSVIWGVESSGKTALAYNCMRHVQQEGKKAVYIDLEQSMDSTWAVKFGLDMDELIYITPGFAEQAVDVVEAMLYAEDVGIVVVDSIAAMTTDNEIASSAEKMIVGGASYVVGKMIRKAVIALSRESHNKHYPALLLLNQQRVKIGTMFSDPNVMPGGNALKFASSMTIKIYGKDEVVKDVHPELPTYKVVTGSITKNKVPILSKAFEYNLALIPHGNIKVGQSPSWSFVATYCKNAGFLTQAAPGKPYMFFGKPYNTQKDIKLLYETNTPFAIEVQGRIISNELSKGTIKTSDDDSSVISVQDTQSVDQETGEILTT